MFYKYENEQWWVGKEIHLPNSDILTENNRENSDGWQWFDEEPIEYTVWRLKQQETEENYLD